MLLNTTLLKLNIKIFTIKGTMGELLTKLRKNENNAISRYQIHLTELHENTID